MKIKAKEQCRWDLVSLGEVMLRLDPGETRISTAREFRAWEGGGRQPRRPVDRRPDVAGRRKSGALALGEIRRSGTHGAKWLELHRAWVRDACRSGLLRPWSHRCVPNETRRNKLGED